MFGSSWGWMAALGSPLSLAACLGMAGIGMAAGTQRGAPAAPCYLTPPRAQGRALIASCAPPLPVHILSRTMASLTCQLARLCSPPQSRPACPASALSAQPHRPHVQQLAAHGRQQIAAAQRQSADSPTPPGGAAAALPRRVALGLGASALLAALQPALATAAGAAPGASKICIGCP